MHRYRTRRGPGPWERSAGPEDYRERERRWAEDRERSYMDEVEAYCRSSERPGYGRDYPGGGRNW